MRQKLALSVMICLALVLLALPLAACTPAALVASLEVDPPTFELDMTMVEVAPGVYYPMLLIVPITFTGSGWAPGETVAIDLVPGEVEFPAVEPGENVGIAFAVADEDGNIETTMESITKIYILMRADIPGETMSLDPATIDLIPAGVYTIQATGATSGAVGTTTIEFVMPAE